MTRYSIVPRTRKYVRGYGFLSFARNLSNKYNNQLLDSLRTASKKLVHKADEFLGSKIADAVAKSYVNKIVKTKPVIKEIARKAEEIFILP